MKVKRNTLLLTACLVWGAAGFNILRLGVLAYPAYLSALNFVLSALVFAVFQYFIFGRLVKKHTARITGYEEERHFFLKFFDVKSFIIMAVMMSGGFAADGRHSLRLSVRQGGHRRRRRENSIPGRKRRLNYAGNC